MVNPVYSFGCLMLHKVTFNLDPLAGRMPLTLGLQTRENNLKHHLFKLCTSGSLQLS